MPKPASKPVIAVDIDDVLALTADDFISYTNQKWGTNLTIDDYDENWAATWRHLENEKEQENEMHSYISQANSKIESNQDAQVVLKKLAIRYKLVIATSRRLMYEQDTKDWLTKNFGDIFGDIHYTKFWDELGELRVIGTKNDVLKQIGANYLIDDQPKHCIPAAQAGMKVILFGDYPWNRDVKTSKNLAKAKNWQEVLEYFNNESAR